MNLADTNNLKALAAALIDDFRGFIVDGKRIKVPDDLYHINIAYEEMKKVEGWEYKSGTGQNPLIDYLRLKKAIYVTRIVDKNNPQNIQRTVGYLKDVYSREVEYKGKNRGLHEIIQDIAFAMGYDVDEYELQQDKNGVTVKTIKGKINTNPPRRKVDPCVRPKISRADTDEMVFSKDGLPIGVRHLGRIVPLGSYFRSNERNDENDAR